MLFDFHTHSFLSDGVLLPIELIHRAIAQGYTAIGLTDHVSVGNLEFVLDAVIADCQLAESHWDIRAVPGVELTHLPPAVIPELAARARARGAQLVVVHGETPAEPVPPGTNAAAVRCPEVDILAHPGPIDGKLAGLAARNGIYLELSAHEGHCLGNAAVVSAAREAGASLLVNSDAHLPSEILTQELAQRVATGAGLTDEEANSVLLDNPKRFLDKLTGRVCHGGRGRD